MAKKATKAEIERRVRIVYEMLLVDTVYADILRHCAREWQIKSRQTDYYIERATKMIVEEAARIRENALETHLTQRASMRNKALKSDDKRLAFEILKDETKLLGLYPADKKEITGKDGGPIEVVESPLDELRSRIDSIAANKAAADDSERPD